MSRFALPFVASAQPRFEIHLLFLMKFNSTMKAEPVKFNTVEEYLGTMPAATRKVLQQIRKIVRQAAPDAEELISYNIPAFKYHGALVYFAGWKEHVSMYPRTAGLQKAFSKELAPYEDGKGTMKFPLAEPMPYDLITRIVQFRVEENEQAAHRKRSRL